MAERLLAAIEASTRAAPPLRAFVHVEPRDLLAQAHASAERLRQGKPLSILDGVPVGVKDELDQRGLPTTVGTSFLGRVPASTDAETAGRLRALGALLAGKTNMHELGLGVTGVNPHHGAARNPHDPRHMTGGSSSGSASAVAAGLVPIALAADGGGSIRIPASLCGLVGLKPTYGRVSEAGAASLCRRVARVGAAAAAVADAARADAALAGPDPRDENTLRQPPPHLDGLGDGVRGLRLGIYRPWFEDAAPEVVRACDAVVDGLRREGATIVEVEVPDLAVLRAAHLVTIVSEMAASQLPHLEHRGRYGADVRLNLALARRLSASDYPHAQRARARLYRSVRATLERVDAILTPSTACTAPRIESDMLGSGLSDLAMTDRIMRFAPLANLTGLPAIWFRAGHDDAGLPIGLQALSRPWDEALLLRIAAAAEPLVARRAPAVRFSLLHAQPPKG